MAPQHDFILDNQNGAQFRADINLALEAIATVSSGAVEPTTTYAYQYWADTTTGYLKQRDASNANWIVKGNLAADYGQAGQVLTSAGAGVPAIWTSITEDGAWTVAQDSTNAHFTFTGNGFDGTEANPDIYLVRGAVYNFTNASTTKGFQIQSTAGLSGTAYSDGITNNPALAPDTSTVSTLVWTVQMDAPSELYYHSTVDAGPGGNIYILDAAGGSELEWTLTANGTTDYIFAGPGFAGTETDPDLYVVRGQTYKFTNSMGAHPFQIQSTQGTSGTAYNDGITNNAVSNGTLTWEVRMNAPSTLYYQCTSHADMNGTIRVLDVGSTGTVASIDDIGDVDTTTVAPTDGQALLWYAANSKWSPGTVSGSGGTSLPSGSSDGEALIWENGAWAVGPVIGGVNYTPANSDANFNSVSLLLRGNGTDGSTTFTDSSSNALTVTGTGTAQISTAQSKFGGASIYFPAGADKISVAQNALFDFGSSAWTMEMWLYWTGGSGEPTLIANRGSWSTYALMWTIQSGGLMRIIKGGTGYNATTSLSQNTWTHVAATYDGTDLRFFVDGSLDATHAISGGWNWGDGGIDFGAQVQFTNTLTGYMDDIRITKGVARYTASFTPPAAELPGGATTTTIPYSIDKLDDVDTSTVAPTNGQVLTWDGSQWEPATPTTSGLPVAQDGEALIYENGQWVAGPVIGGVDYTPTGGDASFSSVELLLFGNGTNGSTTFTDSSNNALTVTANGNAQISTTQSKYGGASAYFDGNGDYLSTPNQSWMAFGTNEFTIECWFYINANSAPDLNGVRNATLISNYPSGGSVSNGWLLHLLGDSSTTGTGIEFYGRNSSGSTIHQTTYNSTISQSTWHHVAVVREATAVKIYLNGNEVASTTLTASDSFAGAHPLYVATNSYTNYQEYLNGYIDDLRITSGVARYTANFTPPTAELPTTGTTVIPASDSIRTLLGIDEYADDTAAGTGGLSTGELYYNTTSSSYVLKS